jgi:hypothetical protein
MGRAHSPSKPVPVGAHRRKNLTFEETESLSLAILSELKTEISRPRSAPDLRAIVSSNSEFSALTEGQARTRLKALVDAGYVLNDLGRGYLRTRVGEAALASKSIDIATVLTAAVKRVVGKDSEIGLVRNSHDHLLLSGIEDPYDTPNWQRLTKILNALDDDADETTLRLAIKIYNLGHDDGYEDAEDDAATALISADGRY